MCGCVEVQKSRYRCMGNEESLFPCFTMREFGENGCEKGGVLSHIRPMCNLIDI